MKFCEASLYSLEFPVTSGESIGEISRPSLHSELYAKLPNLFSYEIGFDNVFPFTSAHSVGRNFVEIWKRLYFCGAFFHGGYSSMVLGFKLQMNACQFLLFVSYFETEARNQIRSKANRKLIPLRNPALEETSLVLKKTKRKLRNKIFFWKSISLWNNNAERVFGK